jgi:hypothetical protein
MADSFSFPENQQFPIASLRHFLLPDQLVSVQVFQAETVQDLIDKVNSWVDSSKSVIAVPGCVSVSAGVYYLTVTYVPATSGINNA